MKNFLGYHSEWNLGSPGGWDYQRITQELGRFCWEKINEIINLDFPLNFSHPLLNPVPLFADMLLRAHKKRNPGEDPFIVLTAEPDTIGTVVENSNFVRYLDNLPGVSASLAAPHEFEEKHGGIFLGGERVTLIYMDFNNDVILELEEEYDLSALKKAIEYKMVVNPRGMEPVGAKGVFEAVTDKFRDRFFSTTVERTPWTRRFFHRSTTGPGGEQIDDLVEWTRENIERLILKPVQGYSGKGIVIGFKSENPDSDIEKALNTKNYIVQELVPLNLWAEESPWLNDASSEVVLERWQTDFRCLITDAGLIGFLGRFGGIPTNVGSGGGTQPLAIVPGDTPTRDLVVEINRKILSIPYSDLKEIKESVDEKAIEMGHTYLLGPIKTALRPRLINEAQVRALTEYSVNLWKDAVKLEKMWREGSLDEFVDITDEEKRLARMAPWDGEPALMASDGLFSFGGHPDE